MIPVNFIRKAWEGLCASDVLMLVFAGAILVLVFLKDIEGPGISYEELDDAEWTARYLKSERADYSKLNIFGRSIPVMINNSYTGAMRLYLLFPFLAVFGINIFAVRFYGIFMAFWLLFFTWKAVSGWLGRKTALWTLLLMLMHPVFHFYSKIGTFSEIHLNLMMMMSIYLWLKWKDSGKRGFLYGSFFLIGLGIWAKIVFVFYAGAFLTGYFLFLKRERIMTRKDWLAGGLAFMVGMGPLIFHNIRERGDTLKTVLNAARLQSYLAR